MSLLSTFEGLVRPKAEPDAPLLAWSGLDVPLEVAEAAGFWPSRLTGQAVDAASATGALAEGGGHPGMQGLTAEILGRGFTARDRIAVGSTPVTGVWLYNLFLSLGPGALPCRFDLVDIERQERPSSMQRNLETVTGFIASFSPAPSVAALSEAIAERNGLRRALRALDRLRTDRLTGSEAQLVFAAADQAPAARIRPMFEDFVTEVEARMPGGGTPIVYSGGRIGFSELYSALEQRGFRIVADDQAFGSRAIGPDIDEGKDPAHAIAQRYRRRDPAPAGWPTEARVDYLVELALARGAKAVIFDIPSFDHPPAWDQPKQAEALAQRGIRSVVIPPNIRDAHDAAEFCSDALRERVDA